jgi:hypothetical protein
MINLVVGRWNRDNGAHTKIWLLSGCCKPASQMSESAPTYFGDSLSYGI